MSGALLLRCADLRLRLIAANMIARIFVYVVMPPGNGRALLGDGMAARQQPCAFWLTTLYGEPFGLNPGQDQETGVIDDELQIFESLGLLPADKALALG